MKIRGESYRHHPFFATACAFFHKSPGWAEKIPMLLLAGLLIQVMPAKLQAGEEKVLPLEPKDSNLTEEARKHLLEKPIKVAPKPNKRVKRPATTLKEPVAMPFYIFNNAISPPVRNFCPSGYMGDVTDIAIVGGYDNVHQENYAPLKICYAPRGEKGWMGMMWQNPNDNWGNLDGGYNLSKATKVTFWAMGSNGDEVVEFKIGGALGNYPDSISRSTGKLQLTNVWKQYTIDLSGNDLSYVSAAFGFFCAKQLNPSGCIFYLDDIKFE